MRLIVLLAALALPTPKAPETCVLHRTLDSYFCPGSDTRRIFTEKVDCETPVVVFEACSDPPVEDDLAEPPEVDPEFDENSPEGPGPGPPGAPTVDRPE